MNVEQGTSKDEGRDGAPGRLRRGFTLVEGLLATALTVLAGAALLLSMESSLHSSRESLEREIATGIAQQLLDEVAGLRYAAIGAGPRQWPFSRASGEGPTRASMDDIDDWYDVSSQPPKDRFGRTLGQEDGAGGLRHSALQIRGTYFDNWRASVEVFYVDDANFSLRLASGQTSYHRAVQVAITVIDPDGRNRQIVKLRRVFAYVPE